MPNYKTSDILNAPENKEKLYGYCGKIARVNLTTGEISYLDTYQYVPKYLGGRMLINRIFWDEVAPDTGAFDEGNKFIYMTGATTGTGIPAGGRSAACCVGASSNPEQYCWGNSGGWFGTELKYAGYDGFIIEGKSDTPVYIKIEDDKIEILPADDLWGLRVHQTQAAIEEKHGHDVKSMVIGPAGENLVRIASITTSNDFVFAKGGFGAVWGSKKLKAITVRGSGVVAPADIEKVKYLRLNMNEPLMAPKPILHLEQAGLPGGFFPVKYDRAHAACSPGCNQHCHGLHMNGVTAFDDQRANHVEKCVSGLTFNYTVDIGAPVGMFWPSQKNFDQPCKMLVQEFRKPDPSDPYFEEQGQLLLPDLLNFWGPDYDRGTIINDICNDYGIDKWDTIIFILPWISACKQEHLLDGNDLGTGMEPDVENVEFIKKFFHNMIYREGYYGNLFAEGMSRAIRELGKDKYGESIYHNRISQRLGGKKVALPVSEESAWGHCMHWQGRGFEASCDKPTWLAMNMQNMLNTRDAQTVEHFHCKIEYHQAALKDPYHCPHVIDALIHTQNSAEIKDSLMSCEWQSPDLWWPEMESLMYQAATGYPITPEELDEAAYRSKLLFRAILIRNYGRTRKMEVEQIWHVMQIPDSLNEVGDWKQWNEMVSLMYEARGWDLETGWPYRETYEKYGLKDVADEMEKLGLLPRHPDKRWEDYGEEPYSKFVENWKKDTIVLPPNAK